jgi:hypothetical protein
MYTIKFLGKRYNNKKFASYEDARKYVRRLVTRVTGAYQDSYTQVGFSIAAR